MRRKVGATATRKPGGGWGTGAPVDAADLRLIRRAVRENWLISPEVQAAVLGDLLAVATSADSRKTLRIRVAGLVLHLQAGRES
ncbi:MAG: hypothetical protein ACK5UC_06425 [Planctomycetaceae bacterium]|jgi:hypothetical protein